MALFNKKQTTSTSIPELQEYYANQNTESTSKAWLLAIGSLLVTIVVLVGIFFGGRWTYRKLTKKDKKVVVTTSQTTKTSTTKSGTGASTPSTTSSTTTTPSTSTSTTTTTTPTPTATSTTTSTTSTTAQGVATTQSTATNTAATAASTTTTSPDKIANTGPGDTVGLFATVLVASYALHSVNTRRKLNK